MLDKLLANFDHRQKKFLFSCGTALALLLLLWILFSPTNSVMNLFNAGENLKLLQAEINRLETENAKLREDVARLEKDRQYVEELARKEHGLIKKNELLYKFDK